MENGVIQALHNASKSTYRKVSQLPSSYWPKEWKTTFYKEYKRFSSVTLPPPEKKSALASLVTSRVSDRNFSQQGLTLAEISNVLQYSCGEIIHPDGSVHRAQPSGGARYAIEVYPIVRHSDSPELMLGVHHYNVKKHALEYLWPVERVVPDATTLVRDAWALEASVIFVITAVFWRSQNKYRARSYRYINMEAGAIMQNAYLLASDTNLKAVGYGGIYDDMVEKLLRLDTRDESVLGAFLVGK